MCFSRYTANNSQDVRAPAWLQRADNIKLAHKRGMLRNNNIDYILSTVLYVLWMYTLQQGSPISEEDCQPSAQVCGYFKGSTDGELSAFVPHSSSVKVCDEGPS